MEGPALPRGTSLCSPLSGVPAGPIVLAVVMAVAITPVAPAAEASHAVAEQQSSTKAQAKSSRTAASEEA